MFKVFNQRLAGFLMLKGFRLMAIEPNKENENFNVFSFEKSPKLSKVLEQYQYIKQIIN